MQAPPNRERQVWTAVCAVLLVGLAVLAWKALAGLGVGLLGLLVLFVAIRVELEGDRPIGTQLTPEFYACHFRAEREQHHAERAGRRAATAAFLSSARMFVLAGALLAIVGFGLIFLGERREPPELFRLLGGALWDSFQRGKPW